jgi:hypothetical protein
LFSSVGRSGATTSITFIRSASCSVRLEAWRTALSAQSPLRPWFSASERSLAAKWLITLRLRSEPRLPPLWSIGVEEPMLVSGAIASTSAACATKTPAEAAAAPFGAT